MNINRHNYETFFLLYVDNELPATAKTAVDLFVQNNPDLANELKLLQQTVVKDEKIVFENKHSLQKTDEFSAFQEKLLLLADGELPDEEEAELRALIAHNEPAETEWKILQQTILKPDYSIVFADKKSIYRTEGSRVVGYRWRRVAAAAVLIGFGILAGIAIYQKNIKTISGKGEIAIDNTSKGKKNVPNNTANEKLSPVGTENPLPESTTPQVLRKDRTPVGSEKNDQAPEKIVKKKNIEQKENIVLTGEKEDNLKNPALKKLNNNLQKSVNSNLENINKEDRNKNATIAVQPKTRAEVNGNISKFDIEVKKIEKSIEPVNNLKEIDASLKTNALASNALYKETDAVQNNNKILYMDEDNVKRSKIGGIFRKLKRVIERNTNIKTGNGLKIAGFEIALK